MNERWKRSARDDRSKSWPGMLDLGGGEREGRPRFGRRNSDANYGGVKKEKELRSRLTSWTDAVRDEEQRPRFGVKQSRVGGADSEEQPRSRLTPWEGEKGGERGSRLTPWEGGRDGERRSQFRPKISDAEERQ